MTETQVYGFVGVLATLWVWNMLITVIVLRHSELFRKARERIGLGLPPFPKAPDNSRDRQYLNRMGID